MSNSQSRWQLTEIKIFTKYSLLSTSFDGEKPGKGSNHIQDNHTHPLECCFQSLAERNSMSSVDSIVEYVRKDNHLNKMPDTLTVTYTFTSRSVCIISSFALTKERAFSVFTLGDLGATPAVYKAFVYICKTPKILFFIFLFWIGPNWSNLWSKANEW